MDDALPADRKEKTTPFGVNLMRSQVLYRAAQALLAHSHNAQLAHSHNAQLAHSHNVQLAHSHNVQLAHSHWPGVDAMSG